ncbi:hypothetical protein DICPUDRAFT_81660 [Dictyostelium purpureum]|uniref:HAT C-terminal dimerisation domain-containing protein n=1 Tax=Dictyostelium purpureum TaxID=5786 RepID=F0ZU68_DICPU|nr:uncharacterized protein DICPUDRAFT_81660 [Dictyostelium purpureum]EGC32517.1 hypothetical protein DICPUDRAFT_81660 [Dictyostelium purpureum]|eukprot:XP_003290967.1 hypothetical protein DICPUDRAFT_81660 [Dictyostelium purpureum]
MKNGMIAFRMKNKVCFNCGQDRNINQCANETSVALVPCTKKNSIEYPTYYSIVRNVPSVASSSVEIERTFSGAKLLVTDNRSNLGWERIEQCVLIREWANISRVDIVENSVIYNYSNISKMFLSF